MDRIIVIKNGFGFNDDYVWVLFLSELVYDVLYGLDFALEMSYNPLKCLDMILAVGHINCHTYVGCVAAAIEVRKELGASLKLQAYSECFCCIGYVFDQ